MARLLHSFPLQALLLTLLVGALLAWPAHAWKGSEGLVSLAVAGALCFVTALLGRVPRLFVREGTTSPLAHANATMAGTGIRVLLTAVGALIVILTKPFETLPFVLWLVVFYSVLLVLEVFVSIRGFGQNHPDSGSQAANWRDGADDADGEDAAAGA